MTQKRILGMIETYVKFLYEHANGASGLTAIVQLTGPLTADLIRQSLTLLQKRHPLLRASLSQSKDGHDCFEIDEEPLELPLDIQERKSPGQWVEIYEQQLNATFIHRQRYLWRLTLLLDGSGKTQHHELIASFHHTIMDGKSFGIFFRDLLTYAQIISNNGKPEAESLPILPNLEVLLDKEVSWSEYLTKSEIGFAQLIEMRDHLYLYEKNLPLHERNTKVIYDEADESQLERMISRSRENKTGLTSLLYAALLIALYKVKGSGDGHAGRKQIVWTPVDMRSNCNPIIGSEHIGLYVLSVTTVHYIDKNTSLWALARSCNEEIRKGIVEQAYLPKEFDRSVFMKMLGGMGKGPLEGRYSLAVGVSNYGALDLPLEFGPFQVKKFHSGTTQHAGDRLMMLNTTSVGGRLYYDFCYEEPSLSEETAKKIVHEFMLIQDLVIAGKI